MGEVRHVLDQARGFVAAGEGRNAEWQTYLREIIDRYRRKRSLVPMLEVLKH